MSVSLPETVTDRHRGHKEVSWEPCLPQPTCLPPTAVNPEQTCCPPRPRLGTGSPAGPVPALLPAADTYPPADQQFPAHSWEVSGLRDRVYSPPGLGRRPQAGARLEPQRTQLPAYHTVTVLQACGPVRCTVRRPCSHVMAPREESSWDSAPDICAACFASDSRGPDCWDRQGLSGWTKITARRGERKDSQRRLSPSRSHSGSRA